MVEKQQKIISKAVGMKPGCMKNSSPSTPTESGRKTAEDYFKSGWDEAWVFEKQ